MSLVGFRAQNHPQQPRKDSVDDRWTPLNLWIPWNDRWAFTLDAAASDDNHLCDRYFTLAQNGLEQSWAGERVWVNPPYSDVRAWAEKAWAEILYGGCSLVVMLAPANRTEQRWWQESVEPYRDGKPALPCPVVEAGKHKAIPVVCSGCRYCEADRERRRVLTAEFLPRRINFGSRDNLGAWSASSAPFGCVLLIWDTASATALAPEDGSPKEDS